MARRGVARAVGVDRGHVKRRLMDARRRLKSHAPFAPSVTVTCGDRAMSSAPRKPDRRYRTIDSAG